jgi:hypothetical protein
LSDVCRHWPGSISTRLLLSRQNMWCMSWCRSCDQDSMQGLQRRRTC